MSDQAAQSTECGRMAGPAEAHKRFQPFAGTFAATVKIWMGPGDPQVSTGLMTNTLDLGGLFLKQVYKGDQSEGPFPNFEGRGFWGYNTGTRKYEGFWIDTASSMMQTETGDVDSSGKVWTMIGHLHDPQSGQPMQKRSVITLVNADTHRMEMFFEGPDGREIKAMEVEYRRRS